MNPGLRPSIAILPDKSEARINISLVARFRRNRAMIWIEAPAKYKHNILTSTVNFPLNMIIIIIIIIIIPDNDLHYSNTDRFIIKKTLLV